MPLDAETQAYIQQVIAQMQQYTAASVSSLQASVASQLGSLAQQTSQYIGAVSNSVNTSLHNVNSALQGQITQTSNRTEQISGEIQQILAGELSKQSAYNQQQFTKLVNQVDDYLKRSKEYTTALVENIHDVLITAYKEGSDKTDKILKDLNLEKTDDRKAKELTFLESASVLFTGILPFVTDTGDVVSGFTNTALAEIAGGIHNQVEKAKRLMDKLSYGDYTSYDEFAKEWSDLYKGGEIIGLLLGALGLLPTIARLSGTIYDPALTNFNKLVDEEFRPNRLNPNDLIELFKQGAIDYSVLAEKLSLWGFPNDDILNSQILGQALFTTQEIREMFYRGLMNPSEVDYYLERLGYKGLQKQQVKGLFPARPPINDLIQFAVREVFSPEQAASLGLFEDFPQAFGNLAAQQGMPLEVARQYWAAHWQLPSPQMAYEMLHRRIITEEQLKGLLKALDYSPAWRDKLTAMSYSPLTRVDVRRMYGLGVIDANQVYESYLDLGYSPTNARRLMEFTIRYESADDESELGELRRLTQATIVKAYTRGTITRADALSRLVEIKYSVEDANLILDLADFDNHVETTPDRTIELNTKITSFVLKGYQGGLLAYDESKQLLIEFGYLEADAIKELTYADLLHNIGLKEQIVKEVVGAYVENTYDQTQLRTILEGFNFTSGEINKIIQDAIPFKLVRTKKPTYTQLVKMRRLDIITSSQFVDELRGAGYDDKYISWMIQLEGLEGG